MQWSDESKQHKEKAMNENQEWFMLKSSAFYADWVNGDITGEELHELLKQLEEEIEESARILSDESN